MKKIITDVDGVLLNWIKKFEEWMEQEDYIIANIDSYAIHRRYDLNREQAIQQIEDFNESAWLSHVPLLDDSRQGVLELHKNGYQFDICSAIGNNDFVHETRSRHLQQVFGKKTFDKFHYVGTDAPKDKVLKTYNDSGCYWIEDKPENAITGLKYGLKPLLYDHPYNRWFDHEEITRVHNWQEICEIVLDE